MTGRGADPLGEWGHHHSLGTNCSGRCCLCPYRQSNCGRALEHSSVQKAQFTREVLNSAMVTVQKQMGAVAWFGQARTSFEACLGAIRKVEWKSVPLVEFARQRGL